jgi:hypothetical protein
MVCTCRQQQQQEQQQEQEQEQEQEQMPCSMMALLLEGDGGVGTEVQCTPTAATAATDGADAAASAGAPEGASGPAGWDIVQEVFAAPAHWQRVKECISMSPAQQQQLQRLWTGLQVTHASFAAKRAQLMQQLDELSGSTTGAGLLGMAWYPTCFAGAGAAAATDQLLQGVDDSVAADYGVLLETSKLLWGDEVR